MARPKSITAAAVNDSARALLDKIQAAVRKAGLTSYDGKLIEDFDPVEQLAVFAADINVPRDTRIKILQELAAYLHPKVKALEVSGPQGGPQEIIIRNLGQEPKPKDTPTIKGTDDGETH